MADNEQNTGSVSTSVSTSAPTDETGGSATASPSSAPTTTAAPATETIASQAPAATEAPKTETAVVAPVVEAPKADAGKTDVVVAEVPKTEVKEAAVKEAAPNILGGTDAPKVEVKADVKDDAPKAEPVIPELPTYEEFTLPENFTADKEGIASFSKILGEMEINAAKLDHAGFQAKGQELINLGTKAIENSINRLNDYYVTLHQQQKDSWFEALKNDPELGRNRIDTTVSTVQAAVKNYGGTEEQIAEFRQLMNDTGVSNNPSLIRLINNMQNKINKYETETDDGGTRLRPAARPTPVKVKPYEVFYAGNK